ncbi:MAG: TetR family transcriptional regulator [Actinobacteria bacterium]|uniref:Unannotated protein n=1 Tax=freshwater metagenome TaxID=449393 RepID=A0A6J5YFV7_9ZZZZ|nr:TetR family transcriptional regulator [Actinomycetota bacterium]
MCHTEPMKSSYHHGDLAAAILGEAIAQLKSHGVDGVTLRSVCGALGVSQSATYHHFKNKESLLQEMAVQGELELTRRFKAALLGLEANTDEAAIARFQALGRAYISYAIEEPNLFTLTFAPGSHGHLLQINGESMEILHQTISQLASRNLLRSNNFEGLALVAWTTVHGFAQLSISGMVEPEQLENLLATMQDVFIQGKAKS